MIAQIVWVSLACILGTAIADTKAYVETDAEVNTECKTCPHSLCPNTLYYLQDDRFNATCWTRGTKIMDDYLWLKSDAGCYVTEYDVLEDPEDYKGDLDYCGEDSEDEHITTQDGTLQYKSECRICPDIECDVVYMLPEETDVTLTCWTDQGQTVIDDSTWLKTTQNCYIADKSLYPPDLSTLDACGPIPFLEWEKHHNANGTTDIDKRSPDPLPHPIPLSHSSKYLINVTIGEDSAPCYTSPNANETDATIDTAYEFDAEVYVQCIIDTDQWYGQTTDFCYVRNAEFWQDLTGDYYRMPTCDEFTDPDDQEPCGTICGRRRRGLAGV